MAYEKQTWNSGDIITADKLNHIEDGISNMLPIVIATITRGDMGNMTGWTGFNFTDVVQKINDKVELTAFPVIDAGSDIYINPVFPNSINEIGIVFKQTDAPYRLNPDGTITSLG